MELKKRGRPRKVLQVLQPDEKTDNAPARKPSANSSLEVRLRLEIDKETGESFLSLVDLKGKPARLDYRRYAGLVRDALREFAAQSERDSFVIRWDDDEERSQSVAFPDNRLLDLAAAAGLLVSSDGQAVRVAEGSWRLVLAIEKPAGTTCLARLVLEDESGTPAASKKETTTVPAVIAPDRALFKDSLYAIADLGPLWQEADSVGSSINTKDLATFLAFTLTRFTGLGVRYQDYDVINGAIRQARPALSFSKIDEYGYLHVRPVSSLGGYPPGFFEDFDVTKVVELDDEARRIIVSEVLFSVQPDELFRKVLYAFSKAAKLAVFEESDRFILEPDFAETFLSGSMPTLLASFDLYESEKLAHYKIRTLKPLLRLSVSSGIDFLEGDASVELGGQLFSYGRFIADYRKQGWIQLSDGSKAYPDVHHVARLERLLSKTKGSDSAVGISFFDVPALSREGGVVADGNAWKKAESFFRGYNAIGTDGAEYQVANATLRPYQHYGTQWLAYLGAGGFNGCLADEMGLGKTVQTIALLRKAYADGMKLPSIVLAPKSLIFNWESELSRFAPELKPTVYYGPDRDAKKLRKARIVITSYATVRIDVETLSAMNFGFVILDESQTIKNAEAKTTTAVRELKARHKIALSGTPIENNLSELYSLFRFLNPGFFGPYAEFARRYQRPIEEQQDEHALRDLKSRIYPFILRRTKRDVLPDLPAKTEQVSYIELEPGHLAAYHQRRLELKDKITAALIHEGPAKSAFMILQALTELRRLASVPEADEAYGDGAPPERSAKRSYLAEAIPEISATGHKCLVFTNYLATVELVSEDLRASGLENLVITGATSDRSSIVRKFQTDPGIRALVMTLKTGGLGLNLTAADYVFILDPWWNAAAESQAIDRTHRIGQLNPVFCYRLIAKGTIEEKMLELQRRKSSLVASLVSTDSETIKRLDEDDIQYLLG